MIRFIYEPTDENMCSVEVATQKDTYLMDALEAFEQFLQGMTYSRSQIHTAFYKFIDDDEVDSDLLVAWEANK